MGHDCLCECLSRAEIREKEVDLNRRSMVVQFCGIKYFYEFKSLMRLLKFLAMKSAEVPTDRPES